jgi:heme oxygenase (biliverdin-producing, ferredoxin)
MTHWPAASQPLIDRLREQTRALHRQAERAGAMGALLRGELPHSAYLLLLQQLYALYGALERACASQAGNPWMAFLGRDWWTRCEALRQDLGDSMPFRLPVMKSTQAYVQRLEALTNASDPALLGHVYVRYLGDLHGGQVLAARVQKLYPMQSISFYEFGDDKLVADLRVRLVSGLNATNLHGAEAENVVKEAVWAFQQHLAVFEEVWPTTSDQP